MFEPKLFLIPEDDGEFSLLAETEVPSVAFTAGKVELAAPPHVPIPQGCIPILLHLDHRESGPAKRATKIHHRVHDLKLESGNVVAAFVMRGQEVLGSARIVLSGDDPVFIPQLRFRLTATADATRPDLTDALCDNLVVDNTPSPHKSTGKADQRLAELDVVDTEQTRRHRRDVQGELNELGWSIFQDKIASGPSTTVKESRESIQKHAF